MVGLAQEETALINASGVQIVDGGGAELFFKSMNKVIFIHMRQFRQLFQRDVFLEMVVNVASDQVAVAAGTGRRFIRKRERYLALQAQQHHLQQVLAGFFIAGMGIIGLLEHQMQTLH